MCKLKKGNTVLFSRGRCNRRGSAHVGVVEDVLDENTVIVVSDRGTFQVRVKDCVPLLSYVNGVCSVRVSENNQ